MKGIFRSDILELMLEKFRGASLYIWAYVSCHDRRRCYRRPAPDKLPCLSGKMLSEPSDPELECLRVMSPSPRPFEMLNPSSVVETTLTEAERS